MRLAFAAVLVAALASHARADGVYASESFGAGAVRSQLGDYASNGSLRIRLSAGYRAGHWAGEAFVAPEFLFDSYGSDTVAVGYGLDIRRIQPVSKHLSIYLRGSMSRMAIAANQVYYADCIDYCGGSSLDGAAGRGLGIGMGAQLSGKVPVLGLLAWPLFFTSGGPKMTGAVFIEDSYDFYRLVRPSGGTVDASITRWTFGVAAGTDF